MAVYLVTGKLGAGKGKFAVLKLLEAAREGRRIAGNIDLHLGAFAKKRKRLAYTRLPDKPTARDLDCLGHGNPETYEEDRNGCLILDELGTWLNARSFQDPARAAVLDWLIHARKHGWDVYLICQNEVQVDKQVREALGEAYVRCYNMRKVRIPIFGSLLAIFSDRLAYLPRFHLAVTRFGTGASSFVIDRCTFRGDYLHAMYDTRQIFRPYPDAVTFTQLHPAYFERATPPKVRARPPLKPKRPEIAALAALPVDEALAKARELARGMGAASAPMQATAAEQRCDVPRSLGAGRTRLPIDSCKPVCAARGTAATIADNG
jgi:hypothetical protein